ncbi:MAG: PAS domain S-box protein [Pseudomonadota bacterium]|nr:PAS domain S-box protein [Pseudomonadota bacterium]MDP1572873.1 PAS domain S-box protein [Pseudomonadota bacterium]MDP1905834.1 PAS domain S-box protein [Pseudomonadota bacterium]
MDRFELYDLAQVGYFTLDAPGLILQANFTVATLLGVDRGALIEQPISRFIVTEDEGLYELMRQRLGETGEPQSCELRMLKNNGASCWVRLAGTTARGESGEAVLSIVLSDISEHKLAEAKQRECESFVKAIADNIPALLGYWTPDLHYTFASKGYTGLFGRSETEMQGIHIRELVGDALFRIREPRIRAALRGEPQSFEGVIPIPGGADRHVLAQYIPHIVAGQVRGVFGLVTDITAIKRDQERLRLSDAALKAVSQGVIIRDSGQHILSANEAFASITGYGAAEIVGRDYCLLEGPLTDPNQVDRIRRALKNGEGFSGDVLHYRKDGSAFWNELTISPVRDEQGQLTHFVGITRDITERKQAEEALRIAAVAFESQESLMITDADSVILRVNRAFTETTGYTAEEAIGQTPRLFKSGRHNAAFYAEMWKSIKRTGRWQGEVWDRRKNGEIYPKWLAITAVKADDGSVTHYVGAQTDISARKAAEAAIKNLAFYDPLTQLPNRRLLNDRLSQAMAASKRSAHYGALMFLDLDNFKPLNDTHGHVVGDALLTEVADRLHHCVRDVDTVARFGGDEFVVLLNELNADKAEATTQARIVAEKIRLSLAQPYRLTNRHEGELDMLPAE